MTVHDQVDSAFTIAGIRSLPIEDSVRPMIIVIVLPFLKLVVEQVDVVADAVLVEELVKLLFIDTM